MNKRDQISDEFINAFVDDELTAEEKAQAYARLSEDETLNREICELRKVRDLVALAYRDPPMIARGANNTSITGRALRTSLAAGLMLGLGGLGGWFLHETQTPRTVVAQVPVEDEVQAKVLFHVSEGKREHFNAVLNEVEGLIEFYRKSNQKARVEVITNGDGLGLVLASTSPYAERIRRMQKEYDNLAFIACQNTIDRYKRELGLTAKLLPGVVVIDSGVAQIMRRQHQGWAYIQV